MGDLVHIQIQWQELGIVIQHLFKVRHQPAIIDRIAMKSTSEMIVDTPASHLARGQLGHVEEVFIATGMPIAQEMFQIRGIGEFGLGAEATVHHVKVVRQRTGRIRENVGRQFAGARCQAREFFQTLANLLDTLRDFAGATVVGVRDCSQYAGIQDGHSGLQEENTCHRRRALAPV